MFSVVSLDWTATSDSGDATSLSFLGTILPGPPLSPFCRLTVLFLAVLYLWLKVEFLPRLCPETTPFLTQYSLPWWSHLCQCLQQLIMCWWIINICSSPDFSFEFDPLFYLLLSFPSPHFLTSFCWLPDVLEKALGSLLWLKGPALPGHCPPSSAPFNYVPSPLCFYSLWRPCCLLQQGPHTATLCLECSSFLGSLFLLIFCVFT